MKQNIRKYNLVTFQGKGVRRGWYKGEWYFSIVDIIKILVGDNRARKYWSDLKSKLNGEGFEVSEKIGQLKLTSTDGKRYFTDCASTEDILRIVQSIPSPKVEPVKQWLAKVGYERIQEEIKPELAINRAIETYRRRGYPLSWIDKRLKSIATRHQLTDEWMRRHIIGQGYGILTNVVYLGTFGKTSKQYKEHKKLKKNSPLKDHMDEMELSLLNLAELSTIKITKKKDSQGLEECKKSAEDGGQVAGKAREHLEKVLGESVVSEKNALENPEKLKGNQKLPF